MLNSLALTGAFINDMLTGEDAVIVGGSMVGQDVLLICVRTIARIECGRVAFEVVCGMAEIFSAGAFGTEEV